MLVLYRLDSEHSRAVETFIRDFKYQHEDIAEKVEVTDYDSRDGVAMASLYDIMQQPAIMVLNDEGGLVKFWEGPTMPLIDEVAGYIHISQ